MGDPTLRDLFNQISVDQWRDGHPFTLEMSGFQDAILSSNSEEEIRDILLDWISEHQPCLFGKLAAKLNALGTCVVFENEILNNPEEFIFAKIDRARLKWLSTTFQGKSSGFVLLVASKRIAYGRPDGAMGRLAARVCSHYLSRADIEFDRVFLDEAFLSAPNDATWQWLAGVNYFCANADGRWWRDHRIPGGLAFSTNSVGHLVKSGILHSAWQEFSKRLGLDPEHTKTPIDSLPKALILAMQTIHLASDGLSGKATNLCPLDPNAPPPPMELKSYLVGKEYRFYRGYYHTDHTLPSPYFEPNAERPASIEQFELDFTYLLENLRSNPDHVTMGIGRRIRDGAEAEQKVAKVQGELIEIASSPRLVNALQQYPPFVQFGGVQHIASEQQDR